MAKYDQYVIKSTAGLESKPTIRELSLLFEDGDDEGQVIETADSLLLDSELAGAASLSEALAALTQLETANLLEAVVTEQMNGLTDDQKRDYENLLEEALQNARQNST